MQFTKDWAAKQVLQGTEIHPEAKGVIHFTVFWCKLNDKSTGRS
jgi:hypothetical protein